MIDNQIKFSFDPLALSKIVNKIQNIKPNKSWTKDSIPRKVLKISSVASANILQKLLHESLETSTFADSLKLVDIAPVFKK